MIGPASGSVRIADLGVSSGDRLELSTDDGPATLSSTDVPPSAMSASVPSATDQLAELTGMDAASAARWLTMGAGDVAAAASLFFDAGGGEPSPAPRCPQAPSSAQNIPPDKSLSSAMRMRLHPVPADNSCLFNSVGALLDGPSAPAAAPRLRRIISRAVRQNPETWSTAILGKSPKAYCRWIEDPERWGGEIELSILSKELGTEIGALDVKTGTLLVYGQGTGAGRRIYLVYSGIHYDAAVLELSESEDSLPVAPEARIFSPDNADAEAAARNLAAELRAKRQFTDVAGMRILCMVCRTALKGTLEAAAHAEATGHQRFGEL
jgi:ubiquitin thioesterase OTU1